LNNEKLKRLLGWEQHYRWRDQVKIYLANGAHNRSTRA
jgi:hypothetical protein